MFRLLTLVFRVVLAAILAAFVPTSVGGAQAPASSPLELINAVNGLRASYGLPLYTINPILMSTAQAQADFLAATGTMAHSGPGGITFTDRLLAAGYPLAGDLSLGGFRAENITGGPEDMPAEAAVNRWAGDAPHLNTMTSPDLTEIGAGVATNNGRVYFVIDAARPTSGALQPIPVDASPVPIASPPGIIYPVIPSTPDASGVVIHEVKPGQSLWLIAIAYETKIDQIKNLNNLFTNEIFPGENLVIKTGVAVTAAQPSVTPAVSATAALTSVPTATLTPQSVRATALSVPVTAPKGPNRGGVINIAIGIILLAILGGILFSGLSSRKRN